MSLLLLYSQTVNAAPTVALNTADETETSDTTPTLEFTGTDAESDDIRYQIEISTTEAGSWYNASWTKRVKVTVLASKVDADLTNYPVYVNLANLPAEFHTNVNQTDARDIRITTADGITEVPREVVFYDSSTDTGELHFKGDVDSDTDTDFYIYYGNAGASDYATTDTYGRNNVWSGYAFVAHLQANATDSKAGATGTATGIALGAAKIGQGYTFDGGTSTDNIDYGDIVNKEWNTGWSISAWLKHSTADRNSQAVTKVEDTSDYTGFAWYKSSNAQGGHAVGLDIIQTYPTKCLRVTGSVAINDNTFRLHHVTYSGSGLNTGIKLYSNATLETNTVEGDSTTIDGTIVDNTVDFMIGNRDTPATNNQAWDGQIDEVRVANSVLTATWISTEYNNQSSPATFYSVGAEESSAVVVDALSGTDAGFVNTVNGGDSDPFTSGQKVSYTVQSALAVGIYSWRVRGKDPSGSNVYGAWSSTRSFEITADTVTTRTILGRARITVTTLQTILGRSRITATALQTITGLSRITKTVSQTVQGLARITATTTRTITGIADILKTTTQTILGRSRITATVLQTIQGLSRITKTVSQTIQGVARITVTTTRTILGKADILKTTTQTIQGLSSIVNTITQTILGKARITATTLQTILGKAAILKTVSQTVTGLSRLTKSVSQTILGLSRITAVTLQTVQGQARVTATTLQTVLGRARVTVTTLQTILGKSRIAQVVLQTIQGLSRITSSTSQTILGRSRILTTVAQTILGLSRITAVVNRTIQGIANIVPDAGTVTQTILGRARMTVTTQRTIKGRASILSNILPPSKPLILIDGRPAIRIADGFYTFV